MTKVMHTVTGLNVVLNWLSKNVCINNDWIGDTERNEVMEDEFISKEKEKSNGFQFSKCKSQTRFVWTLEVGLYSIWIYDLF